MEQLHLSLAGNLLSTLGGTLELYDPCVVPQYPGRILYGKIPQGLDMKYVFGLHSTQKICFGGHDILEIYFVTLVV